MLIFKGIVHPKMKVVITHPHVVPNLRSSNKHKLRFFWWNPKAFWPCIDRNVTTTFKTQKGSKDNVKIVLTVQLLFFWSYENTICVQRKQK